MFELKIMIENLRFRVVCVKFFCVFCLCLEAIGMTTQLHVVDEMIQKLDSNNFGVSVMSFRRDHQTTLSCKCCEAAVVNV